MKRLVTAAVCMSLILTLCPVHALASGSLLDGWLEKLEALTSDSSEEYSEETPEEKGAFSARELYEMTEPKVVEITTYDIYGEALARGSGFFIDDNGTVVTNYHVIEGAYSAEIETSEGTKADVLRVRGYDALYDLAILGTSISGNPYLKMSDREIRTGDTIYTLGSSLGLTGTFSDGMVATASRKIDGVDYIQITAPISHGNSGGPLINIYGEAIGVNTMYFSEGQNVNFSVNIHELTKLDVTKPVSLEVLYYQNGGTDDPQTGSINAGDPEVKEWLDMADMTEIESNDSIEQADYLRNGYIMAGSVDGEEDFDCYGIRVIEGTTIDVLLIPYYTDDIDYLIAGLVDEEGGIIGFAEAVDNEDAQYLSLVEEVEEPGTYYLLLCVEDEYPYREPAYYVISTVW